MFWCYLQGSLWGEVGEEGVDVAVVEAVKLQITEFVAFGCTCIVGKFSDEF